MHATSKWYWFHSYIKRHLNSSSKWGDRKRRWKELISIKSMVIPQCSNQLRGSCVEALAETLWGYTCPKVLEVFGGAEERLQASLTIHYCQKAGTGTATSHIFISQSVPIWKPIQTDAPISLGFGFSSCCCVFCGVVRVFFGRFFFVCFFWFLFLRKQFSKFQFEKALCVSSGAIFSAHHDHLYLCCVGLTWVLLCYLQSSFGLEAELQVFAHCPSAWPTHDLYSKFL